MSRASTIQQNHSPEFVIATTITAIKHDTKRSSELVFDKNYLHSHTLRLSK